MADSEKRIIEFNPADSLENDDWFAIDSPTTGTRKVQKTQIMGDEIIRINELESEQTAAQLAINNLQDRVGMSTALNFGDSVTDGVNVLSVLLGAEAYVNTRTYAVGEYCVYDKKLYKCTTAVTSAEDFDSTKWTLTNVKAELTELNSSLTSATSNISELIARMPSNVSIINGIAESNGIQFNNIVNQNNKTALIVCCRYSTNEVFLAIASYYQDTVYIGEITNTSNKFTVSRNTMGTVLVKHSTNNGGVHGFAIIHINSWT